jgi:hypothetical protein
LQAYSILKTFATPLSIVMQSIVLSKPPVGAARMSGSPETGF